MRASAWLFVLGGCGRIGIDPTDVVALDATDASGSDPELLLLFTFESDGFLRDRVSALDATCTACPVMSPGRVGEAGALFDGTQCIHVADEMRLRPRQFTIAAWTLTNVFGVQQQIVARPNDGDNDNSNLFRVFINDIGAHAVEINQVQVRTGTQSTLVWRHVATTYDEVSVEFFIDGASQGSELTTIRPYLYPDPFLIGCDRDFGTDSWGMNGQLDDVRFYRRVLTPAEISDLAAM